ncbi:type II toxin-antitoxin system RelE family toxin [Archangium sp.]|uniref:type II toxin-antitoxin system RelE family toxin n=1 Tax=Archangium sp. TaxID=1872627 RepID=UPI00389AAF1C
MPRSDKFTGYTVEVSSAAWKQLARLPLETYQRIRGELENVSTRLAGLVNQSTALSLVVGDYMARYAVSPERKRLTLLELEPRAEHTP